jgi:hypothetical protein
MARASEFDDAREQCLLLGFDEAAAEEAASDGDQAALAGAALLRLCWAEIDGWAAPGALKKFPAANRLAAAGGSLDDLRLLARGVAYSTIFRLLYLLDEGPNFALRDVLKVWEPGFPEWALVLRDNDGRSTDQVLHSLHEGLLMADPSGNEARDFLRG